MHKEIERKHLVKDLPADFESFPHTEIAQGYLSVDPVGSEVRLRRDDEKCLLTAKARLRKGVRIEREISLSERQFEELWPATKGRRLYKTRYRIPSNGIVIEIDIYHGRNKGLIVAEVEFPDEASCAAFQSPAWFGEDVSDVPQFSNFSLAGDE
jgi:adenylate cyclase